MPVTLPKIPFVPDADRLLTVRRSVAKGRKRSGNRTKNREKSRISVPTSADKD